MSKDIEAELRRRLDAADSQRQELLLDLLAALLRIATDDKCRMMECIEIAKTAIAKAKVTP